MTSLTFIDALEDPERNKRQVRQHTARVRRGRVHHAPIPRRQGKRPKLLAKPIEKTEGSSSRQHDEASSNSNEKKIPTQPGMKALQSRWRYANVSRIENIKPPDDIREIQFALTQASNWMIGNFASSWASRIQSNPTIYDLDNRVEILRESFYIVTDLLESGRTKPAFAALNHILDTIPSLLQNPHPELFFCLMELSSGINMMKAPPDLHQTVKDHVAKMASVVLGDQHPITVMLKLDLKQRRNVYVTELVFACVVDTLTRTFGFEAYQTLCQQFGRSQFYAATGRIELGKQLISGVVNKWTEQYGPDSPLARIARLELHQMENQQTGGRDIQIQNRALNDQLGVENSIGIYGSKWGAFTAEVPKAGLCSPWQIELARHLLNTKRYTLAVHIYSLPNNIESTSSEVPSDCSLNSLADRLTAAMRAATIEASS